MSQASHRSADQRVDFFIAGGQKCGTTALHRMLKRHPGVQLSRPKEAHFFDQESWTVHQQDWDDPDYDLLHALFPDWSVDRMRGECTPIYTFWPQAMERIQAYNPDARIVMALRHPVHRAYSHWRMQIALGKDTIPFPDAIRSGRDRVRLDKRHTHRNLTYVERGFYAEQVRRLFDLFGTEQVLVFRTDDLWSRPDRVVAGLLDFLGLEQVPLSASTPQYVIPYATRMTEVEPLSEADREMLTALYADDLRETAGLVGIDLEDWLDPGYVEPMSKIS